MDGKGRKEIKIKLNKMADPTKQFKPVKFCSRRFGFVVLMGGLLGFQDSWHTYGQIDK